MKVHAVHDFLLTYAGVLLQIIKEDSKTYFNSLQSYGYKEIDYKYIQ